MREKNQLKTRKYFSLSPCVLVVPLGKENKFLHRSVVSSDAYEDVMLMLQCGSVWLTLAALLSLWFLFLFFQKLVRLSSGCRSFVFLVFSTVILIL